MQRSARNLFLFTISTAILLMQTSCCQNKRYFETHVVKIENRTNAKFDLEVRRTCLDWDVHKSVPHSDECRFPWRKAFALEGQKTIVPLKITQGTSCWRKVESHYSATRIEFRGLGDQVWLCEIRRERPKTREGDCTAGDLGPSGLVSKSIDMVPTLYEFVPAGGCPEELRVMETPE